MQVSCGQQRSDSPLELDEDELLEEDELELDEEELEDVVEEEIISQVGVSLKTLANVPKSSS